MISSPSRKSAIFRDYTVVLRFWQWVKTAHLNSPLDRRQTTVLHSPQFDPVMIRNQLSQKIAYIIALIVTLGMTVACAPARSVALAPTPPPLTLPTLIPPTRVPPTPTTAPTPTPIPPTPTTAPTADGTPTVSALAPSVALPTATIAATSTATPTSAVSPTPALQAGLFVTGLRTLPDPPVRGPDLKFLVTFSNGTGRDQNYRWLVQIYKADTPNKSFGETTVSNAPIPPGAIEQTSLGAWRLPLGGPCDYFFARVVSFNADNKPVPFTTPDGKVFEKGLTICPP